MTDCLFTDPTNCLYNDPSTRCSYYSNETNLTYIPESVLISINSTGDCTWLLGIIHGSYTAQDVWRDLLPVTIFNPNFTNCYGEKYMDYFNISSEGDRNYSLSRNWLIPRGLSSLTASCPAKACLGTGTTGNPDIAGIGVSWLY